MSVHISFYAHVKGLLKGVPHRADVRMHDIVQYAVLRVFVVFIVIAFMFLLAGHYHPYSPTLVRTLIRTLTAGPVLH